MANDNHLVKLKEGVETWNQWRVGNSEVRPDLSEAVLPRVYLEGANLSIALLYGSVLAYAQLGNANLSGSDLSGANLDGATLDWASLRNARLRKAYLTGSSLYNSDLSHAQMIGALFEELNTGQKVETYERIAQELSQLAGKKQPWGWRYIQSVHRGTVEPSHKMTWALQARVAALDDVPSILAAAVAVEVLAAPENKIGGSYVMSESRLCANPSCNIRFVPNHPSRIYCPVCSPPTSKC